MQNLHECGARLLDAENAEKLKTALFQKDGLNQDIIARDIDAVIAAAGIAVDDAEGAKFLLIEGTGIGAGHPESGEKLSLVTTYYRADDFTHAQALARAILHHHGTGHSVGIHSKDDTRPMTLGAELPVCRVIVNQAHCFATGGAFDNGMPFSLSMGCGTWGGNSIDENFNYRHLMNITKIVRTIPPREPSLDDIFGDYWRQVGEAKS